MKLIKSKSNLNFKRLQTFEGYVKSSLIYGQTMSEEEYNSKIKPNFKKLFFEEQGREPEGDEWGWGELDEWIRDVLNIEIAYGYYHSQYKVGFSWDEDDSDIRSGQDFIFDFKVPTEQEAKQEAMKKKILLDDLGLDIEKFSFGVGVENY